MANSKITGLDTHAARPALDDLIEMVDTSDTTMAGTGTNKQVPYENLVEPLVIVETGDFQIDPAVHKDRCLVLVDGLGTTSGLRYITLPEIADHPEPGYTIDVRINYPAVNVGMAVLRADSYAQSGSQTWWVRIMFFNDNWWGIEFYGASYTTVFENVDPV